MVKALKNIKTDEELVTTYGKDFWNRRIQWNKLTENERKLAYEWYHIEPNNLIE